MSKTILLADDSVTIRKVVELTFMEEDYELVSLGSGEEAIEQLPGVDPDLVVADVHMPGTSGYEVCRKAKELRAERPVLLLVGTFEPLDAAELEASGADAHLKKPFDSQELLQTVRDLLAERPPAEGEAAFGEEPEAPEEPGAAESEAIDTEAAFVAAPSVGQDVALEAESGDPEAEFESAVEPEEAVALAGTGVEAEAAEEETASAPTEASAEDASPVAEANAAADLSDESVERIARRVVELLGPEAVRDVAWEVVPDLAEVVIKERLRELESQVE